jgi:hypothetical protein
MTCEHLATLGNPEARTPEGCEECLAIGSTGRLVGFVG